MLNYKINSYTRQAAPFSQTKVNKLIFEADFPGGSAWESNPSAIFRLLTFLGVYVNGIFQG